MGFSLTSPAPEKCAPSAENRVWGVFGDASQSHRGNRPQFLQARQGNRLAPTTIASGRTYWPSRDPIEEEGGENLYRMVGNSPVSFYDKLGLLKLSYETNGTVDTNCGPNKIGQKAWAIQWVVSGAGRPRGYIAQGLSVRGGYTECKTGKTVMFNVDITEYFRYGGGDLWEALKPPCSMGWVRFYASAVYVEGYTLPSDRRTGHPVSKDAPSVQGIRKIKKGEYTRASNEVKRTWSVKWNCCKNKKMDPGVNWYLDRTIR